MAMIQQQQEYHNQNNNSRENSNEMNNFCTRIATPSEFDVICGKGRAAFNHVGNKQFREIVKQHLDSYSSAINDKTKKSRVISSVIKAIRSNQGDFVNYHPKTKRFITVSDRLARAKVGSCMRDLLHFQYSSSTKAKRERFIANRRHEEEQIQSILTGNNQIKSILKLANEVIQHVELISDEDFENHFTLVNKGILMELKESRSIETLRPVHFDRRPSSLGAYDIMYC